MVMLDHKKLNEPFFLCIICVHLTKINFTNLFYYSAYICYYLWVLLYFYESYCNISVNFDIYLQYFKKKNSVSIK